jgi:AcrR family transcriptional regulator
MSDVENLPPRTRKPRGQGASRRGEILAAASRLFLEEGVAHATMRRIAAEVGVSPTALYVYFPDKAAILQAIAEATFESLLATLEASQQAESTLLAQFRAGLRAYVAFGRAQPDSYRLTFLQRPREKLPCDEIAAADHSFAILHRGVEGLITAGLFRPVDPVCAAEAIWSSLHGVTTLLIDQAAHIESDHDALVDHVIDTVVAGHLRPDIEADHCKLNIVHL